MSAPSIANFLEELAAHLPVDLPGRERILAEIADHLTESAARIAAQGLPSGEAESIAVDRFGDPGVLAALFRTLATDVAHAPPTRAESALSVIAAAAGLVGTLGLLALAGWSVIDPDPIAARGARAAGLLAGALLAGGVTTWLLLRHGLPGPTRSLGRLLPLALVPIGVSAALGTLELGRISGDYEWYGVGIGLALVFQGVVAWWLLGRRPAASAAA